MERVSQLEDELAQSKEELQQVKSSKPSDKPGKENGEAETTDGGQPVVPKVV